MKTLKKENELKRVSDTEAISMTKQGWKYVSKSEWKAERKPIKVDEVKSEEVKVEKKPYQKQKKS
jgi:hypothetical protein